MSDQADRWHDLPELSREKVQVMSLSLSPDLLWLRESVLQQAEFDVFSTVDPNQALLRIQAGSFDVLLLCYSLPPHIQQRVARQFRQSCPGARIVAITNLKNLSASPPVADVLLSAMDGPDALITALRTTG